MALARQNTNNVFVKIDGGEGFEFGDFGRCKLYVLICVSVYPFVNSDPDEDRAPALSESPMLGH